MTENWQPIIGTDYQVNRLGMIKHITGQIISPINCGKPSAPYLAVRLYDPARQRIRTLSVARIVARIFLGDPPTPTAVVRCKDGDNRNIAVDNLTWALRPRVLGWENNRARLGPWRHLENYDGRV